jgi:rod shape-determining protein MreC
VVLTLIITNLPNRTTSRLKADVGSLFLPLFGLAGTWRQVVGRVEDTFASKGNLLRENESLRRENQQLRLQAARAEEIERENARLRQLFGWQQQSRIRLKLARVVARDPANWWRTVQIDLGQRDGLRENMPVLSADGFMAGRLSLVSQTRSQVVLLGDPGCKVPALIQNEARDNGIIGVSGPLDSTFVEMDYLSANANVKAGQNVVTSGYSAIYPKDISIGKIVDARPVEYGLAMAARVKLGANLNALEEVWVIVGP